MSNIHGRLPKTKRDRQRIRVLFIYALAAGVVLGAVVAGLVFRTKISVYKREIQALTSGRSSSESAVQSGETKKAIPQASSNIDGESAAKQLQSTDDSYMLTLINSEHVLDPSYAPKLADIGQGYKMDERAAQPARDMLAAAEKEGLHPLVISAYRSYDDQKKIFNDTMTEWVNKGYTMYDSYEETKKSVAIPGTSEHAAGLAVDITASSYTGLDDKQFDTAETKWLIEHCWEYGFILRYPRDKVDITGIIFEPWHYRYVGKAAAQEIHETQLTLEEYLAAR